MGSSHWPRRPRSCLRGIVDSDDRESLQLTAESGQGPAEAMGLRRVKMGWAWFWQTVAASVLSVIVALAIAKGAHLVQNRITRLASTSAASSEFTALRLIATS